MPRILVLDGHSTAALTCVRALGRNGFHVTLAYSSEHFAASRFSRYVAHTDVYPSPEQDAPHFVEWLTVLLRARPFDLVIPMTDATIWPLSYNRLQFEGLTHLCLPPHTALEQLNDKYHTVRIAQKLGIAVPRTLLITRIEELETVRDWGFPLVMKDRFSIRWSDLGGISGGVVYAYSYEDLVKAAQNRLQLVRDVLVQEYVEGNGIGFSCFLINKQSHAPFQWRRLREKDPKGSGSSARISEEISPLLRKGGESLLQAVGFEGIAMVEYKRSPQTGCYTLMEVNARPWGSIHLPVCCGINYPLFLVEWFLHGKLPPTVVSYRKAITSRSLVGDLVFLENVWEGKPIGWPSAFPNFWWSLLKVAIPWYPGLRYEDISLADPMPGLAAFGNWMRRFLPHALADSRH